MAIHVMLLPLREKCPYSELFWSLFSRIWTEYEEILCISSYSVRMRENANQNSSKYRHFLRSVREWHRRGKFLKKKTNRITFLLRLIFQQNGQFFSNMIVTLKAKTCEEMAYV